MGLAGFKEVTLSPAPYNRGLGWAGSPAINGFLEPMLEDWPMPWVSRGVACRSMLRGRSQPDESSSAMSQHLLESLPGGSGETYATGAALACGVCTAHGSSRRAAGACRWNKKKQECVSGSTPSVCGLPHWNHGLGSLGNCVLRVRLRAGVRGFVTVRKMIFPGAAPLEAPPPHAFSHGALGCTCRAAQRGGHCEATPSFIDWPLHRSFGNINIPQ